MSNSEEIGKLIDKYKQEVINTTNNSVSKITDNVSINENIDKKISLTNEWIINKSEQQKIELRDRLTKTVTKYIWTQLIFFNIMILLIVLSVTVQCPWFKEINNDLATLLFDFLKYYIAATIAELLGMLVFILHYVFSKSTGIDKINNIKNKKGTE